LVLFSGLFLKVPSKIVKFFLRIVTFKLVKYITFVVKKADIELQLEHEGEYKEVSYG
jgi:hypothetical protein